MTITPLLPAPAIPTQSQSRTVRRVPLAAPRGIGELFDASRLWRGPETSIELTVVVPFYNPGTTLRRTVLRLVDCLRAEGVGFEVIAVSDGSTDGSEDTLAGIDPRVRVLTSPRNQGKGAALHLGFARARGSWVGFIDADGDIDPAHVVEYLRIARRGGHAGVYADKRHARSESAATAFRRLVSLVYSTLVTMLFLLAVRDTQTGCKIFRRDVLADLLPRLKERRFAFDLEFFVAARACGISDLVGAPVRLQARMSGSTVTTSTILRTVRDTFTIFGRLRLDRQYGPKAAAPSGLTRLGLMPVPSVPCGQPS
ncbi:MAG: glycosyltransferase family 2 protein [Dactylosporangium sp.]|nr:glycosyltransferase family 2 protein [Dactylosporangium sp.]NNJ61520.1 glycosyltransferase family 2 protein [Dactylosporangium sp.]